LYISAHAQVTPFKKSVLDSLSANEFNGSLSYGLSLARDGVSSLYSNVDLGLMYSTKRSNYEIIGSSSFNKLDSISGSNRVFIMGRGSLFSHTVNGDRVIEKNIYPEPFVLFSYDGNRGIKSRWQFGVNGVYAFRSGRILRLRLGAGLLYEMEEWQMIRKDQLSEIPDLPEEEQRYLFDTVGIRSNGVLFRNNIRANLYSNLMCAFTPNVNLNVFFNVQMPFVPPYRNLPPDERFPVVTKRYPRITTDMLFTVNVWKKLNLITNFSLQYDEGQIPLYVQNLVYSLSQGFELSF
jgi:hypothetical protein